VIDKDATKALGVEITTYVGTDNRAGGRLGADAMTALVDRGARVAVITGIPGDVGCGLRADGFKHGNRGRFDVVATIAADFERAKAKRAAADLMRTDPRINGFFAVNDLMALGVVDAPVQVVTSDNVARARANFPEPVEHFDDPFAR
jgi:ABC-type sugar transport system substrate-binding protein